MKSTVDCFASRVFDDKVMRERLPGEVYQALQQTINDGAALNPQLADTVAKAMCAWAIENGATHFTHWFQPLTGITAEKHDSFISPSPDGRVIMEFSGKELIKGEPDASSFPSGGLRATFEARGYTAWDPSSFAFIKDRVLCIPTAFCSYSGEALDKKTPLLRSMEALNRQALRILKLFGNQDVRHVSTNVGPEQEYFLIDRELYRQRRDLVYTGRTLFGARPPKGQELDDHYFGAITPRVQAYMEELNEELWKLGIFAKTEHNEVAPAQHELASIYRTANAATDNNQLVMEIMKKVAEKHGLVCLLHEKPFAGINGSGKHNNWSLSTDTGINLLSPGDTPQDNAQFLLFLLAVIEGVDEYQDLLRLSVASAANDHRLGANEAPPAVISVFLGEGLTEVLYALETDSEYVGSERSPMKLGVDILPVFPKDTTDRNRTSPFAFTGNKFEFRMVGSSDSIACPNIMLNAAVAESLRRFADTLEGVKDFDQRLHALMRETITSHKRIIFNGNGYDDAWIREATVKRGLLNLRTTPDALPRLLEEKNIRMLIRHGIFTEAELHSRLETQLENYVHTVEIEARTMSEMAWKEILPAISAYTASLAAGRGGKETADSCEGRLIKKLYALEEQVMDRLEMLDAAIDETESFRELIYSAAYVRDKLLPCMASLRESCDRAEKITASEYWPFPTYGELLFGI